jgi:ribosomal protein L37AE/L43A
VGKICPIPVSATSVERNINFLIEHQCPQCGAPAVLEETDRLFNCQYCRVKSFLIEKSYFRYMFADKAPPDKKLLFFPYWRFKGMFFSCGPGGIQHRFMDLSHQAVKSSVFPVSVGLRSQALKLRFVSPDTQGRFLSPTFTLDRVMDIFDRRYTTGVFKPILHKSHIGESLSLIYSPFYVEKKLYDGILNNVVSTNLPDGFDADHLPGGKPQWQIRFIPTLCPSCGWDLEGKRDAIVLMCRNCTTMWLGTGNQLKQIRFAHVPSSEEPVIYLPFWRIKAEVSGVALTSYADLVKLANLPKVIQKEWHTTGFRFWALGFKVRPQTFLRLNTAFTLSQPREKLETALPDGQMYPVNLPIKEAVESLKMTLAAFLKPRERLIKTLPDIDIRALSALLVYIPFIEKHHDLVHSKYPIAVNKNQLRLSANL